LNAKLVTLLQFTIRKWNK